MNEIQTSVREKVYALEDLMKLEPQVELQIKHHFSYGLYGRELFIPAGVMLTGKIHKYPQMNVLLCGQIDVLVGNEVMRINAPDVICSPAGTKRIARAITDTRWLTVHATEELNVDKIEHHFIAQSEDEFLEFVKEQQTLPLFEGIC